MLNHNSRFRGQTASLQSSISYQDLLVHNPDRKYQYYQQLSNRYRSQSTQSSATKLNTTQQQHSVPKRQTQKLQLKVPFQVYKSNKPLTEFKEFKLRTALRNKESNKENINKENISNQYMQKYK